MVPSKDFRVYTPKHAQVGGTHTHTHTHANTHTNTHTHTHTYIHTRTHKHTDTHTHITPYVMVHRKRQYKSQKPVSK